jgi:streptogramin lyase
MKLIITLFIVFGIQLCKAQTYSGPESVEFDNANNRWLIANTQSHQVLARDNSGVLSLFVGSLGSGPYGIEIVGDTLFCCSGSSIKGFLLSNGSPVFTVNLGATFLNGLTHDASGNLFATDFSAKTIHKLNIASQTDTIVAVGLVQSPNGIIFDSTGNRCIFVNWGSNAPIKAIDLSTYAVSVVSATTLSNCDGIAQDGNGRYYVSNWGNQSVVQYDNAFSTSPVTVVSGLNNPADIFYNSTSDTLAIPNAGNNTVTFFGFNTVSIDDHGFYPDGGVFPNPSNSNAHLFFHLNKSEKVSVELYSISGNLVSNKIFDGVTGLNNLPMISGDRMLSGIYFIRLISDKRIRNYKWIIE